MSTVNPIDDDIRFDDLEQPEDFAPLPQKASLTQEQFERAHKPGLRTAQSARVVPENGHACEKCRGTGQVVFGYTHRRVGKCYTCNGRGYFRLSAADRAKSRAQRQARAERKQQEVAEQVAAFVAARPDLKAWFERHTPQSRTGRTAEFARSLHAGLLKYGSLTERQLIAVQRSIDLDREHDARRAAAQPAPAPKVACASKLHAAFARAKAAGLRYPRLTIGGLVFTPAGDASANAGCLYVKADGEYVGKITPAGELYAVRSATQEQRDRVTAIGEDPAEAARVSGKETGTCSCCGRELTDPDSIALGIGPICASKWGF